MKPPRHPGDERTMSVPEATVGAMRRRIGDRPYRTAAELIRALRDEYLLTQGELAGRSGLSRHQLCRWEKGTRQPPLDVLRRILAEFGHAVTLGVESRTAAVDERLELGVDAIGMDTWLMAQRVVWPALRARVPLVVGGELAAALQGVPIEEPEMVLHLRMADLDAFQQVVAAARCTLGVLGPSLDSVDPEEITVGSELAVVAMIGTIRIRLVGQLPVSRVVEVEPEFVAAGTVIDVPVVPLDVLQESGDLAPAVAALAERLLPRAPS
jgi:transcriptional regulator with XRE-family HTH domain